MDRTHLTILHVSHLKHQFRDCFINETYKQKMPCDANNKILDFKGKHIY